jgi:hypothetical protein
LISSKVSPSHSQIDAIVDGFFSSSSFPSLGGESIRDGDGDGDRDGDEIGEDVGTAFIVLVGPVP